jgi:precorrin-3B synthase
VGCDRARLGGILSQLNSYLGAKTLPYDDRVTLDRCPGVLRPHLAEDGAVVRIRIPGGRTTGPVLAGVSRLAQRYGNGEIQLTTRASLQIRGLPNPLPTDLVDGIVTLGLLPSATHDRVRNIVASPLTGLHGGCVDLRPMITELDQAIVAQPALAALSGRFLFALDDGRGDVSELAFDLAYIADSPTGGHVRVGEHSIPTAASAAVETLVGQAHGLLVERRDAAPIPPRVGDRPPLGVIAGAVSVLVPLGQLTPDQAAMVAGCADDGTVIITPWRGLIVPGAANALPALVAAGLITDERSGWTLVSACVGAPHCARTALDTRTIATELVAAGVSERVHVSGCGRRCGAPRLPHRELVPQ